MRPSGWLEWKKHGNLGGYLGACELSKVQYVVRTHQDVLVRIGARDKLVRKIVVGLGRWQAQGMGINP